MEYKQLKDFMWEENILSDGIKYTDHTWISLANKFRIGLELTNSQRSDKIRRLAKKFKNYDPNEITIEKEGLYVILGCMHVPFHNKKFFDSILEYIYDVKPQGLILLGDFVDLHSLSSYDRHKVNIPITTFKEYAEANKALDILDSVFNGDKYYLFGNHEARAIKFHNDVANHRLGKETSCPIHQMKLIERNYKVLDNYNEARIIIGDVLNCHGWYHNKHSADKHITQMNRSVFMPHTHRFNVSSDNKYIGYNVGFGGNIKSSVFNYGTKPMKGIWKNSFATQFLYKGKNSVNPILWKGSHFSVNDKIY